MPSGEFDIRLNSVSKYYSLGAQKVRGIVDVSLEVERGSFLVVIGPSGAGKTTLLNIISGIVCPDHGDVIVLGRNIGKMGAIQRTRFRAENIGYVFQDYALIEELTVLENVVLPGLIAKKKSKRELFKRALELLELVGLKGYEERFPRELSGGEQQRVAIARALINDPRIILADEPTSNLDTETGREIVNLIYKLSKDQGKTTIIATHDEEIITRADRIVRIRDGKLEVR